MVHPSVIEARIGKLGFRHSRWFRAEIDELQNVLMEQEQIVVMVCGRYFGSFALLVATDQRLLLIDKRVFFMTIEDTRYDMVSEINYNSQVYSANATIYTINKTHKFSSIKYKKELRDLTNYVQKRVMEFRQQRPSDSSSGSETLAIMRPPAVQAQRFPSFEVSASAPANRPQAQAPTDFYKTAQPQYHQTRKHMVGHVAHAIGSAAMSAAHHHQPAINPRAFHPYVQGSLMTRGPTA